MTNTAGYDVTGVAGHPADFIPLAANAPLDDACAVARYHIGTGDWDAVQIKDPATRVIVAVYTAENPDPEIRTDRTPIEFVEDAR